MKKTFRTIASWSVIAVASGLSGAAAAPTLDLQEPQRGDGVGSATAEVRHLVTGRTLANMPVHVRLIVPTEGSGGVQVFITGRDGRALLSPLESGSYEVYVDYNNNRSRSVFFEINGDTDVHPFVTLHFNPDIDVNAGSA